MRNSIFCLAMPKSGYTTIHAYRTIIIWSLHTWSHCCFKLQKGAYNAFLAEIMIIIKFYVEYTSQLTSTHDSLQVGLGSDSPSLCLNSPLEGFLCITLNERMLLHKALWFSAVHSIYRLLGGLHLLSYVCQQAVKLSWNHVIRNSGVQGVFKLVNKLKVPESLVIQETRSKES